jgi:hypothetical protein
MLRLSLIAVLSLACSASARSREYIIRGWVLDAKSESGVSSARVRVPAVGLESVADTAGRFEVAVRQPPGCYLLRVRMIGYGGTDRTVHLESARVVEVGDIVLREAPIPEWRLLFLEECALPDSVTLGSLWGTDTVRLHP